MQQGIIEQLTHSTVRLECTLSDGELATGTGFLMKLCKNDETHCPVIITNKHVVEDAVEGEFVITLLDENGQPDFGNYEYFTVDKFEQKCIAHPDPNIDLVAFPIGKLLTDARESGLKLYFKSLECSLIPSEEEWEGLSSLEEIIMIGYPSGIWDEANNFPVIRRGITATHANIKWNDDSEFLADIASFEGSSGSPVFLANLNGYSDSKGNMFFGEPRIKLLGILYAGTVHTAEGEVRVVKTPTKAKPISITEIPNNIGVVINSKEIFELQDEVQRHLDNGQI